MPNPKRQTYGHSLNMGHVADWLIEFGPASWRDDSRPAVRTAILKDLARRTFAAEFWTAPTPATDRLERATTTAALSATASTRFAAISLPLTTARAWRN